MIKSMTGFGRGESLTRDYNLVVEMKSVNNRYSDIILKAPKALKAFEESAKKIIKSKINRGRVEVFVTYNYTGESDIEIKTDIDLANQYKLVLEDLSSKLEIENKINLDLIAKYPDVIVSEKKEENIEALEVLFLEATKIAVNKMHDMREIEGKELYQDLVQRKYIIETLLEKIELYVPDIVIQHKIKLETRIKEMLGAEVELDESKLLNEVAYFADKSNITEEIVRLKSHLCQLESILKDDEAVGRKLDFLIQEMNRETNTMGSKVQDLKVTNLVIEVKSELEKIREQVQNIE